MCIILFYGSKIVLYVNRNLSSTFMTIKYSNIKIVHIFNGKIYKMRVENNLYDKLSLISSISGYVFLVCLFKLYKINFVIKWSYCVMYLQIVNIQ